MGMARTILVVDDEEDLRRIISRMLSSQGKVLEAADGAEAVRIIKESVPDLLLLDVTLPDGSGLDVLKQAHVLAPALPVLMLTGQLDIDTARDALEQGARAYMTKPFEPSALKQEVARLLGGEPVAAKDERPWRVREAS
jgi:DNA-binding NtrC family response regulator